MSLLTPFAVRLLTLAIAGWCVSSHIQDRLMAVPYKCSIPSLREVVCFTGAPSSGAMTWQE